MAQMVYCLKLVRKSLDPYVNNEELIIGVYSDKEHTIKAAKAYVEKRMNNIKRYTDISCDLDKLFGEGMTLQALSTYLTRYYLIALEYEVDHIYS